MSQKPIINQVVIVLAVFAFFFAIGLQLQRRAPVQDFDRFQRIASALEAYALDHGGKYPPHIGPLNSSQLYYLPNILTTPVAYLTGPELLDPLGRTPNPSFVSYDRYRYINIEMAYAHVPSVFTTKKAVYGEWMLWSPGYDRTSEIFSSPNWITLYDPTNGMISRGDMLRSQRMMLETGAE